MSGAIPPFPITPLRHGAQLKHGDNFTFTLLTENFRLNVFFLIFVKRGVSGDCNMHTYARDFEMKRIQKNLHYLAQVECTWNLE
jgi:hypothetical protein